MPIILTVLAYFAVLFGISRLTARRSTNETFYRADRRSPWYMVAFGMVGASISGVTFVSVPGMVQQSQMTYLQTCLGFVLGYVMVAFVLLPLYYRLNLTSIYAYLGTRFGRHSHKTGSCFFLLSKMAGASVRFYVVCIILQRFVFQPLGVPFAVTVVGLVLLIWLYTWQGGIKTLVWTDSLQTICLFAALLIIIYKVVDDMGLTFGGAVSAIQASPLSRVFVWDDWMSKQYFWKQFLSGAFIVVVMTGLDQDMMQKNLTCKTLRGAQKDMCTYGVAFLPANLLFLSLGVLLTMLGTGAVGDELLPAYVEGAASLHPSPITLHLFTLGIVAASFSSADSALTSLTTIVCVDIVGRQDDERLRRRVHIGVCAVFVLFILLFKVLNSTSLIDAVYIIAGYTYGPLLGLFAFGLFTRLRPCDSWAPYICVASPLLCYGADALAQSLWNYHFGYELLMLNGLLTFLGLWISARYTRSAGCQTLS
jgi:Na+/proline symporter